MNRRLRRPLDPALVDRALSGDALSKKEKLALLNSPDSMWELHRRVWTLPERQSAPWGL